MNQFDLNEQILAYWKQTNAFQESLSSRSEKMKWKFYDGPPFTSGDPHYGHLLQSAVKDAIPRWMTMRGYKVARKRGWDCHGIPAENFVNKKLGITSKKQVLEEFGLQQYVEECRTMVNNVNDNWKRFVEHIGRWADMENAYFTMHDKYMESVIHLFADLYHNNLIYKGFKVLGYSRALGTALSNSEIAEGYMDRQDPAVTVKLQLKTKSGKLKELKEKYELTEDGFVDVVSGVIKNGNKYCLLKHNISGNWEGPGGKVHSGESLQEALRREVKEEFGIDITSEKSLGSLKTIYCSKKYRFHYFGVEYTGEPTLIEDDKYTELKRVEKIESDNEFGFALRVDGIIVDDIDEIRRSFVTIYNIHLLEKNSFPEDTSVSLLARTTTPRTLPSNMFGAVNADPKKDINYVQIFDVKEKEYFVLAESLLTKFYKDSEEYIHIYRLKGADLVGLSYEPLFDYYYNSPNIDSTYHDKVHKILHADFVTEDSGTGIAHEAPAFGEDDYNLVTGLEEDGKIIFAPDMANERLFNPVDDNGEFTDEVPDFAGMNVIEANKHVIQYLKDSGTLLRHETINHSYPHCPRTKEPIIYRAMESRFLKEKELSEKSIPLANTINFVPREIKKRFTNGLESAPDWNISRSRFWGAPLPIWECEKETCEQRNVYGSMKEIADASGQEVTDLHRPYIDEITIDCACGGVMRRIPEVLDCWFESGSMPYAQDHWMKNNKETLDSRIQTQEKVENNEDNKNKVVIGFTNSGIREISSGKKTKTYRLGDKYLSKLNIGDIVSVQNSATEEIVGELKVVDLSGLMFGEIPLITAGHPGFDSPMDKILKWKQFYGKEVKDNERVTVIDFDYISASIGNITSEIPGEDFSTIADFIAEGLDQTRGWFRSLHVLGTAYTDNIVYKNVVVTGMILAEDGKKMSKSLKNYPDPKGLLEKYGADAFRLYVLGSPVVRAEPLRFQEKGVEQVLKDFVIPLQNVWNFFKTYAEVDDWKDDGTEIYFMRHAEKDADEFDENPENLLSEEGMKQLISKEFVENIIRIDADVIYTSNIERAVQTAKGAQKVMSDYLGRDVEVIIDDRLAIQNKLGVGLLHKEFSTVGKRILCVSHQPVIDELWKHIYGVSGKRVGYVESVKIPSTIINNELDQRILSELHSMIDELDDSLESYQIEPAVKILMGFMDKITNRRLRRSRRRFWVEGMTEDKHAVYWTLWEVLSTYLKLAAPFTPFVTEWIWQEMNGFRENNASSIHLEHWPLVSQKAIDTTLSEEVAQVRKIIKGAMYIRAKKKVKVKQPLQELKFKI